MGIIGFLDLVPYAGISISKLAAINKIRNATSYILHNSAHNQLYECVANIHEHTDIYDIIISYVYASKNLILCMCKYIYRCVNKFLRR